MQTEKSTCSTARRAALNSISCLLLCTSASGASGEVRCWGYNKYGQCAVPADLGRCVNADAGLIHSVAVLANGSVRAWGDNNYGQCNVPANLGVCTSVAAGYTHTMALQQNGIVRAWGFNSVPAELGPCTAIDAGTEHSVALRTDGAVRAWGRNDKGQTDVPSNLGPCVAVAAGYYHTMAIAGDGSAHAWGWNTSGQCEIPQGIGPIRSIVAGSSHTVALRADRAVVVWGDNTYGQRNVPTGFGPIAAVAAGESHTLALRTDGKVVAWGRNDIGQCNTPSGMSACGQVSGGGIHSIAVTDVDCNENAIPDQDELPLHDCNGDLILDACNAVADILEDCNSNGLGDSCEKELSVSLASGQLSPIGYLASKTWTVQSAVRAQSPVTLTIRAHGDFGGLQEYARVRVGVGFDELALRNSFDCGIGGQAEQTFVLTPEQFNAAIGSDGALRVVMEPSIAVDANGCNGGTWIEASLEYVGARPADCNANGLLDRCEIAAGYSPDANGNGVVDTCESLFLPCPADFNQSATVDGSDLGVLLLSLIHI